MDESQKAFQAFMKTMTGLQASFKKLEAATLRQNKIMEEQNKRLLALEKSIKELDEHNAYLLRGLQDLSDRLDLASGVSGILQRLLPGGKR